MEVQVNPRSVTATDLTAGPRGPWCKANTFIFRLAFGHLWGSLFTQNWKLAPFIGGDRLGRLTSNNRIVHPLLRVLHPKVPLLQLKALNCSRWKIGTCSI